MKIIITEEMRWRKKLCDFALKHGVTKAARRYKTNRMFIYRLQKKYDGVSVLSLTEGSRRPLSHPKQHTEDELELIRTAFESHGCDGLAEVYVQSKKLGYTRSFGSMCKKLRRMYVMAPPQREERTSTRRKHEEVRGQFPGDKVQVDIKYVPERCLKFNTYGKKYYQITAIDEFSRKRILVVVDEKSAYNTSMFVKRLEKLMVFKINTIQTDNGSEFTDSTGTAKNSSLFEKTLAELGIKHVKTAPYSPWQNGKVERSHRIDNIRFYSVFSFNSRRELEEDIVKYTKRYNEIAKQTLGFKNPNQMVQEYYLQLN